MTSPTVQGGLCQTRDSRVLDGRGGKTLLLRRRRHVGELSTGVRFHTHPLPAAAPKTVVLLRPLKCHCNKKGLSSAPRLYSNRGFPPGRVQNKGAGRGASVVPRWPFCPTLFCMSLGSLLLWKDNFQVPPSSTGSHTTHRLATLLSHCSPPRSSPGQEQSQVTRWHVTVGLWSGLGVPAGLRSATWRVPTDHLSLWAVALIL